MEDTMDRLERSAIIISLIEELRKRGSWCGETHVQKAAFLLQEIFKINLGFRFILYKHGPFSFNLRYETRAMQADRFISLDPTPPYGVSLAIEKKGTELEEDFGEFLINHNSQIEFIADCIGDMGVANLERLSTALYVTNAQQGKDVETRSKCMKELKPHINLKEARSFINSIDDMMKKSKLI